MRRKLADKIYCDVCEEKIRTSSPILNEEVLRYHHLYIFERHKIYKKKEIEKLPSPWTKDEVFKKYRFTNVRRELDRESIWLIENICESNISLSDKILNCILFRTYNKSETSKLINMPITNWHTLNLEEMRLIFEERSKKDPKYVFFTPAFMTGGLKKGNAFKVEPYTRRECTLIHEDGTKETGAYKKLRDYANSNPNVSIVEWERNTPTRMLRFIKRAFENGIAEEILNTKSQKEVFEILTNLTGFGKFLAYQVYVDFTYIPEFKYSENEFTISGPGCASGLNFLFDNRDGMTDEELLFWCRDNLVEEWKQRGLEYDLEELFYHLPEYDRCLNVMMLENSMCELSKYTKAKRGDGRPRNIYKPTEEKEYKEGILESKTTLGDW
jgi:hypothetical protein